MRSLAPSRSACLATLALCLWGTDARADLIDPAEEVCSKAGEACNLDGQDGACQAQTCSRLDYGNPEPDGTPGTMDYECVRCVIGAKVAAPEPAPAPKDDPRPDDVKAEPMPQGGPAKEDPAPPKVATKGTRCAVEPSTTSMLSFALGLGLLGLAVRRRR